MKSNRELYLFVLEMLARHKDSDRSLEEYLRALWGLGSGMKEQPVFSLGDFAGLLEKAFEVEPPGFDPAWSSVDCTKRTRGFESWEQAILCQIVDLKEMREAGVYRDELRTYGVSAPRGGSWYNFDPLTYLECAMQGSFGGWQPGDDSGRMLVPGGVAVAGEGGKVLVVDPAQIQDPVVEIESVSWEDFTEFLWAGQSYE